MTAAEQPTPSATTRVNARGRFTLVTGVEADYHSFARREMAAAGYRGPMPFGVTFDDEVRDLLDPLLEQWLPTSEGTDSARRALVAADRLLVGWDVQRATAVLAARSVHIGDLTGWHLTLCVVERAVRRQGLMRHLVQILIQEEPMDFLSTFVDKEEASDFEALRRHPIRRIISFHSPGAAVDPDRRGHVADDHESIAASLRQQLRCGPATEEAHLVVGDLAGVRGAPQRWDAALAVKERSRTVVVTGTNGKTSTVEYGRQIGESVGARSASFGTLGVVTVSGRLRRPRIGVGADALPELADRLWSSGVENLWVEGFSFALQQGLLDQLAIDVAAFTQVGSDHLGSHRSLVGYWASKERLFRSILRPGGVAVLDPRSIGAGRIIDIVERRGLDLVTTGPAGDVELVSGHLRLHDRLVPCPIAVSQAVMVDNLQLAIGCCLALGMGVEQIVSEVGRITAPPGRFTELDVATAHRVVIDSAHNADALEASLTQLRSETSGRLLVLIASVGSADESRWEPLGEVAEVLADVVVVTDESPYRGDADRIRAAIRRGCPRSADIADRRAAISWLLAQAEPNDVVMIAGRADEDFLVDAAGSVPFPTDAELVEEAIRAGCAPAIDHGGGHQQQRPH